MKRSTVILFRILVILYIIALAILCFGHFGNLPQIHSKILGMEQDKVFHFLMFLPFPILAFFAFDKYTESPRQSFIYTGLTCAAGCLLAAGTELIQSRLSYRSGDQNDFIADFLAIILGSLIVLLIDISKQKKS